MGGSPTLSNRARLIARSRARSASRTLTGNTAELPPGLGKRAIASATKADLVGLPLSALIGRTGPRGWRGTGFLGGGAAAAAGPRAGGGRAFDVTAAVGAR
jgi:hypothetical protein